METLTVDELKKILNELPGTLTVAVDYPGNFNNVHQVYLSNNQLWLVASDNKEDSGIDGTLNDVLLLDKFGDI